MNIELIVKLITIAGSVFALYKGIIVFVVMKKSRLRDEYKFAKQFITDLKPDTHPFVIEAGYLAMSGKGNLKAPEIIYLLSLPSPVQALEYFSVARQYVELKKPTTDGKPRIVFREKYTDNKRRWLKYLYLTLYYSLATLAFAPIPFAREIFGNNWQVSLVVIFMAFMSFGPLAYNYLMEYAQVRKGEDLVAMQ